MTPTPQQIRSPTYKLDRAADELADLDYAPLSESVARIRAESKALNKLANGLPDIAAYKLKLGYVSSANEVSLVKQIGATYARIQSWPGGAKSIFDDGAFKHGIEVAIRIAREYKPNTTSVALEPLKTDAQRSEMIAKVNADLAIYKTQGVKSIILGNEPDGTRNNQPRYWSGHLDRFGTDWARHIAPLVRAAGMRVGFGLPIFPSRDGEFVADLVTSGAYKPGDYFAANVYGGNCADHHKIVAEHVTELLATPTFNPSTDFEISEAGLKRGGGQEAWMADFLNVINTYRSIKFPGAVSIYRIRQNDEAPFAPFKAGTKPNTFEATATLDRWKQMAA